MPKRLTTEEFIKRSIEVHDDFYDSIEAAFNAYKCEREKYIKEIALIFKGKIPTKVYNALINYEVEITD